MSASAPSSSVSLSVPVQIFHEGEGHQVLIELRNGEIYRGHLHKTESNMNCLLHGVSMRTKSGAEGRLESVYLRGSQIRFVVLPDTLKNAPVFIKVLQMKEAKAKDNAAPSAAASKKGEEEKKARKKEKEKNL